MGNKSSLQLSIESELFCDRLKILCFIVDESEVPVKTKTYHVLKALFNALLQLHLLCCFIMLFVSDVICQSNCFDFMTLNCKLLYQFALDLDNNYV